MKLLDYIRGLRKGKEAHRLEKESMKDPFLADAMDGYHRVEGNQEQQIRKLQMIISARSTRKKNLYAIGWSVAACLIIGIGISTYFLIMKDHIGDEVFIAKENMRSIPPEPSAPIAPATPDTSATPSMEVEERSPDHTARVAKAKTVSKPKQESMPMATAPAVKEISARTDNYIRGIVVDEQGEPLIGVNVYYKDSNLGTLTNLDGEFSLKKKNGDGTIVISFIGYETVAIPADANEIMTITMHESSGQLDEVVVMGHTAKRKLTMTGAITTVSLDELKAAQDSVDATADTLINLPASEPVIGMKKYKKYLKKNLIRPTDEDCDKVKGEVVLSFFVNKEGRPYDIKVKESLCESSDKEAIRLIQEGPDWTYGNKKIEIIVKF